MTRGERESPVPDTMLALIASQFGDFYRENYVSLLMFATGRVSSQHDAEELVTEAFIVAWKRYRDGGLLDRAWIFGVLKNKIGDHRRRAHTTRSSPVAEVPDMPTTVNGYEATALRIDVQRALVKLSDSHREALILTYWCDLSTQEAAQVLGISHGAYRVRLTRAKQELCRVTRALHEQKM
uniref:RNA polymerase sigma factor n=1 Tax=Tessaracoccus timonensis TaxID=2161816 RepID=UPI00131F2AAA|nr:sigma-70 family RNA polymerase sigma factor [Tessaracoccus timonensis]